MNPGATVAAGYVPAIVAELVSSPEPGPPWGRMVEGTLVMADVSGFTAMSERLAQSGQEGAERLTGIINRFFEAKLELAQAYGGDVLTFGGDAILLLFRGAGHAERAVSAAWRMLQETRGMPSVQLPGGRIKLGMSVGAHSGGLLLAAAGTLEERMQLFAIGDAAAETAAAEAQAGRGELVVTKETAAQLTGDWKLELASGRLRAVSGRPRTPEAETGSRGAALAGGAVLGPDIDPARLLAFAPPPVRQAFLSGSDPEVMFPEHRRVSVVFVRITGLNQILAKQGAAAVLPELQRYAAAVLALAARHRGFLVSTDIDQHGVKLILAFGAPVAHEFAAANAARFAIALKQHHPAGSPLEQQIGVAGGRVFAGDLGPAWRRQYTVMGDEVNLAARLMASAQPGTVVAPTRWVDQAGGDLCVEERPAIRVKGKEQEIAICVLQDEGRPAAAPAARRGTPLLGRRRELELFKRLWAEASAGHGRVLTVSGEAGVGKSRFLDEAISGIARGADVVRAQCREHLQGIPFAPWVEVLTSLLGLTADQPFAARTAAAATALDRLAPDMNEFRSLLNPLLAVSFPSSEVVSSLDVGSRRERLIELMIRVVAGSCPPAGLVLLVEDVHWSDESSLAMVHELAGRVGGLPLLLLLTLRPSARLPELADTAVSLPLRELTFDDCVEFVRTALGAADLPAPVVAAIHAKTHGNPLFLEEVVYSLQAPGTLERILRASSVAQAAELAALAVPDRVQGLLMSRVDSAPPSERDLLKVAAVVGQEFTAATLRALPSRAVAGSLDDSLAGLRRAALIVPLADGAYRFQHALLQEVTYDSLPYQRRRQIHAEVAAVLETATEHPGHGLLVHHYRHAGDAEQTRVHAVRASETSQAVYAFQEAADYLAIALDTVRGLTPDHACLRSRLEELAGDCLESLARHDEAIEDYIRARRRWMSPLCRAAAPRALAGISPLADPEARDSDLCWKVARCVEREHKGYRRALRWLRAADETLPPGRDELASRLEVTRGVIFFRLGDLQRSLESCEEGLTLARRGDDERAQAYALAMLASPLVGLGRYERAIEVTQEAVRLYERAADLAGQAAGHGNLAACYQFVGDLQRSLHHHDVSLELNRRLSYRTGTSIVHNNIAEVLLQLGRTDEAVEHLRQVVDRWEERKTPPALVGFALVNLSRALLRTQDLAAATKALDEGRRILTRIRAEGLLMEADLQLARLLLAEHRTDEAQAVCRKLVDAARLTGARLAEVQALCLSGTAEASAGDRAVAEQRLRAAIGMADELGAEYEKAVALAALAGLFATAPQPGGRSPHEPLSDAIDLFRRIGADYDLQEACGLRDRCAPRSPD